MSTDAPERDAAAGPEIEGAEAQPPAAGPKRRMSRTDLLLLFLIPVVVLVALGGWVVWRLNVDLDSTEQRQLAWRSVIDLTIQHIELTLVATFFVLIIAIPLGVALTRPRLRRAAPLAVGLGNAGQAAPAIGLIVLLAIWLGFTFSTAVIALTLYAILPVLRNTIVGIQGVDPTLVEAGRGIGMSNRAVLFRIELPLAVPVIMTGVRTALVLLVGTAALATFINAGGLGTIIDSGIKLFRYSVLVSGALLVALLALLVDWVGRVLELLLRPKGV